MRSRVVTAALAAAWIAAAAHADEPSAAPTRPTQILTRLRSNELLMLKSVRLRNAKTGEDVVLRRDDAPILVVVEPGSYYLRRVDTAYFNIGSVRIPEPPDLFEVEAGRVSYLGDLLIAMVERPTLSVTWNFLPDEGTLAEAIALHPEAFAGEPAVLLVLGGPAIPIRVETERAPEPEPAIGQESEPTP